MSGPRFSFRLNVACQSMSGSVTRPVSYRDFSFRQQFMCSSFRKVYMQVLFVSALEGQGVEDLRALLSGRQMLITCTQIVQIVEVAAVAV